MGGTDSKKANTLRAIHWKVIADIQVIFIPFHRYTLSVFRAFFILQIWECSIEKPVDYTQEKYGYPLLNSGDVWTNKAEAQYLILQMNGLRRNDDAMKRLAGINRSYIKVMLPGSKKYF